jgi:aerobic carbon-monoxide dehydrogenase large subunit
MPSINKSLIGQSLARIEDSPLVRGQGCFIADVNFPHQLHMRVVRSSIAHGRIRHIDTQSALTVEGVHAIWTAQDISDIGPIDFREGKIEKLEPYRQPVLAQTYVRYVGEPIAVVFAENAYCAEDAADLVEVDIDPLPVIDRADAPPGEFAPHLSTQAAIITQQFGDIEAAFAKADKIVELDLEIGRHSGVPLETRGAIGRYDRARDVLELHGAAKVPHKNRESLARMLGRSTAALHLFEYHVGGGFGIRGEIYPEDILVLVAALRLNRPVKWIEDRREHLMCANQSRHQRHKIKAAVDRKGRLLAIENEFYHDQGAYPRTHALRIAETTCGILPGPYHVGAYKAVGYYRLTHKTPCATYRAPGRYETNFVRERLLDAIAKKLNMSRVDVRIANLIDSSEMPYARPLSVLEDNVSYDSGDYKGLLQKSLKAFRWDELEDKLKTRRANGEIVGAGFALFIEKSGLGPIDGAYINVDSEGGVEVITGGASVGQGFETVMAQVSADILGVNYRNVRVIHGRTDRIEYGIGAHASRATVMTANAVGVAAHKVRVKALDMAGHLLQIDPAELTISDGQIHCKNAMQGPSISLGALAQALRPMSRLRGEREPGLSAHGWFESEHQVYPYGNQFALVKIDPRTGHISIEDYLIAYDIGKAINPMLVRGQIIGGFVQGLGGAIYEEFLYDEQGQPLSTSFADYLMPTLSEVPEVKVLLCEDAPSPRNPLGIKGAGESGIAPVGAVIASAVEDALQNYELVRQLPLTPQRIKSMLDQMKRV